MNVIHSFVLRQDNGSVQHLKTCVYMHVDEHRMGVHVFEEVIQQHTDIDSANLVAVLSNVCQALT